VGSKERLCGELRVLFCVHIPDSSEVHLYRHFHKYFSHQRQSEVFSIDAMGCFANTNEISHVTTKWGVRIGYVGSYVYFFVYTSLIQVKFICIVIFVTISVNKGNPKFSPFTQWDVLQTQTKYHI